jgi:hypothetical protein
MKRLVLLVTVILTASCAAGPQAKKEWAKTRPDAEDFEMARARCERIAERAAANEKDDGLASRIVIEEFVRCMRERGWETRDVR